MSKLLLIDGDFILWKCVPNKVISETEQMYGISSEKTIEETFKLLDWYIEEKIFKQTNPDGYIAFLGGENNFRKELSIEYKGNRIDKELPKFFNESKQYLVNKWSFNIVNGIEAEDAVGIALSQNMLQVNCAEIWGTKLEMIIVGQDHDLKQLPGTHYNPVKEELITISQNEACYNFWRQMIEGCSTDKVKGIVNNRKNFVKKTIGEYKDSYLEVSELSAMEYSFRPLILEKYIELYGEYNGIDKYAKNYKLLKILRDKEDFIVPKINKVNKVVKDIIDF